MATIREAGRAVRRDAVAVVLLGVCSLAAGPLTAQAADAGPREFRFERLDRTYEAFITDLAPVEIGPAIVELSSPEHSLTLVRHLATLDPLPEIGPGEFAVELEVRFAGSGTIEADVTFGRVKSHLSDELAVPVQTLRIAGRVQITAAEEGFWITTRELPSEVTVQVESALARRLFGICHQMVLVLVNLDCVELEQALTHVRVPMPPAGESYLLPYAELTAAERDALVALLPVQIEPLEPDGR